MRKIKHLVEPSKSLLLVALGVLLAALSWAERAQAQAACDCWPEQIVSCGHRGTGESAPGNPYPENTIPSFAQAAAEGATMIELDVMHSADGVLVVFHDDTLDRTTDGTGCAGDLTVAELQQLDAAVGTSMEGQGVQIPTLDEVLAAIDIGVNIELKMNKSSACPPTDKALLAADVAAAIAADGKDRRIVTSSFDLEVLQQLKAIDPGIAVGYLSLLTADGAVAAENGFEALSLYTTPVTEQVVADLKALGLEVDVWTVNGSQRMKELVGFGVDMIITDEPDVFVTAQQEICDACPTGTGGAGGTGGASGTGGAVSAEADDDSGCSCRLAAGPPAAPPLWPAVALGGLALATLRRRRERR